MNAIYRLLLLGALTLGGISGHTEALPLISGQEQSTQEPDWKQKGQKWFLCNLKGEVMTPQMYEKHGKWLLGAAWVMNNGKFGFVNTHGQEIVPLIYEDVIAKFCETGTFVRQSSKWGYLSWKGDTLLPFRYDFIGEISPNGLIGVNVGGKTINDAGKISGGKWGFINTRGQELSPLKYDHIGGIWKDGVIWVNVGGIINNEGIVNGGKFGLVDSTVTEVISISYDGEGSARKAHKEGSEKVNWQKTGAVYVLYDKKSKSPISKAYDDHGDWNNDLACVTKNQKYGCIDKNGKEIIPPLYENMMTTRCEYGVLAKQNGKWGFLDRKGKTIIPFQYDIVSDICDNGVIAVNTGGKWGYINSKGQILTPLLYDYVSSEWKDGIAWVNQGGTLISDNSISGGKFGLVDSTGTEVLPLLFEGEAKARQAFRKGIGNQFEIKDTIPDIIWNY